MFLRCLLVSCLLLLLAPILNAQTGYVPVGDWKVGIGLLMPFEKTVDPRFSSLTAKGIGIGGRILVANSNSDFFVVVVSDYRMSNLKNSDIYLISQRSVFASGDFGWFIHGIGNERIRIGIGINSMLQVANRSVEKFINLNRSSEAILGFGANIRFNYKFPGIREWSLENSITLPFFKLIKNDEFGTGEGASSSWKSSFSFSSLFFRNSFVVGKDLSPRSFIGLEYVWMYYRIDGTANKTSASHQTGVKYLFKL